MKKNLFCLVALMLMALPGVARTQFPFLDALDLDVTPVITSGATTVSTSSISEIRVKLTTDQSEKLLGGLDNYENEYDGAGIHIARKIAGGNFLLLFRVPYPDGDLTYLVTYDKAGVMIDYINTSDWCQDEYFDLENDSYIMYDMKWGEFKDADKFVLHRTVSRTTPAEVGNPKELWSQQRDYYYSVDANGFFTREKIVVGKVKGKKYTKTDLVTIDLDEFTCYVPKSAKGLVGNLHQLCLAKDAPGDIHTMFSYVAAALYRGNKMEVLNFIYSNPKSPVVGLLEFAVSDGNIEKYDLYQAIAALPDGKQKTALHKLTAQWGPAGAVG
ncbi:MAG: hypothetical protein MJZ63_02375 [Muribaculaceae bacterium]|nr:hypothetical protein [Muribaculaceae bacterium]